MYTDEERSIVRAGMGAVRAVLFGADVDAARRLLFCLDWFMDPYYQNETFGRDYRYDEPLAGAPGRPYTGQYRNDEFAGRECAGAKQITRLPDGTEIHKPVEACREAYYGGWTVRD